MGEGSKAQSAHPHPNQIWVNLSNEYLIPPQGTESMLQVRTPYLSILFGILEFKIHRV